MHYPYRRIVTGLDAGGKSAILFDDDKGFESAGDAVNVALLWQSGEAPADNSGLTDMAGEGFSFAFARGATKCILVEVRPTEGLMPPGMHATDTLDYAVVLQGRLTLYMEDAEAEAGPGDVIVNRGSLHAWRNKGPEVARMLVVNVDAAPVGSGATYFGASDAGRRERAAPAAYGPAFRPFAGRIDGAALMREAEAATGLSDWGGRRWNEERFRHDLSVLCDAIEATAEVSPTGRSRSHGRLHTMLVSRLRYIAARNATPGVDAQRVVAPLVGSGMPRAGTTFLHGLIAQDPANRVARAYEAAMPVPVAGPDGDARCALYHRILDFQGTLDPAVTSIHPFGADLPEECIFLQEGDGGSLYTVYWNVPDFAAAIADKRASAFDWQLGAMQYLQAASPGGRWALKAPGHMFVWEEMRMAFPDALVYVNHRDPARVVPSITSLFMALRGLFSDTASDPVQVGAGQLEAWSSAMNAYVDWRSGPGKDADVVDIHFADLTARPVETVEALYDRFAIPFTPEFRERLLRHLDADRHGKEPKRQYTLAEFGMDEAAIEARFGRYIDHFGIRREKRA